MIRRSESLTVGVLKSNATSRKNELMAEDLLTYTVALTYVRIKQ